MLNRKVRLSAFMPPTPCTPEMREKLIEISKEEKVSLAEIQRTALSLFLNSYVSKADAECPQNNQLEQAS